jgi:hypothetical protein
MFGIHPDLRRHVFIASVSSAALGVAGLIALTVAWWSPSGPRLPLLLFGAVALSVSSIGLVIAPRWYRRASGFVTSTRPSVGEIVLHLEADSDATSLYASLLMHSTMPTTQADRFLLIVPRWPVDSILDVPIEAKIYRDPHTQRPVAFQVTGGFLWCFPHWRAAQQPQV